EQKQNLAKEKPEIFEDMKSRYMERWPTILENARNRVSIPIGSPNEPIVRLCVHDWDSDRAPPPYLDFVADWVSNGRWWINVEQAGHYRVRLRHFPEESALPVKVNRAAVIADQKRWEKVFPTNNLVQDVVIDIELPVGEMWFETELDDTNEGIFCGAFYVYIEKVIE
ncbi:MAG: hypothetical protein ACRCUY_02305, partial [Thermoguttaceae bacterium]